MQSHVTPEFLKSQGLSIRFPKRFFEKVRITPSCWIWSGCGHGDGYGQIAKGRKGCILAHRASWILHFGAIPNGMGVLHDCPDGDNRSCVNPAHLWLGTAKENTRDAVAKGTFGKRYGLRGSDCPTAKLTWAQVREIRMLRATKHLTLDELSKLYGIAFGQIGAIIRGVSWVE